MTPTAHYRWTKLLRESFEDFYLPAVRRLTREQVNSVLNAIDAGTHPYAAINRIQPYGFQEFYPAMFSGVAKRFAKENYIILRRGKQKNLSDHLESWLSIIRSYAITQMGLSISSITETTREHTRRILFSALEEGLSIPQAARRLKDNLTRYSSYRAVMIARTEIVSASNYGSWVGANTYSEEFGVEIKKVWLATMGNRTRDTHKAANKQKVGMQEKFKVGGYLADFPGDPSLPAKERVRCRCTVFYED